jgi:hypothetical protein
MNSVGLLEREVGPNTLRARLETLQSSHFEKKLLPEIFARRKTESFQEVSEKNVARTGSRAVSVNVGRTKGKMLEIGSGEESLLRQLRPGAADEGFLTFLHRHALGRHNRIDTALFSKSSPPFQIGPSTTINYEDRIRYRYCRYRYNVGV